MENSDAAVGILMHFHGRPDEVRRGALNRRSGRRFRSAEIPRGCDRVPSSTASVSDQAIDRATKGPSKP